MAEQLAPGFLSVEEAIELINSDTRKDPVVDTAFILRNLPYLQKSRNYTIRLLKRDKTGKIVANGSKFVHIDSDWQKENLKHAITEHYKTVTGKIINPDEIGLKSITTTKDAEENPMGNPIKNKKPMTKLGDDTTGGTRIVNE